MAETVRAWSEGGKNAASAFEGLRGQGGEVVQLLNTNNREYCRSVKLGVRAALHEQRTALDRSILLVASPLLPEV